MKRILITAYDVDPYRGSESATGWNYPLHLSKYYKVTVVTRKNNLGKIDRYINENNIISKNLSFIGFDLPKWACFWKRGGRGSFLYFYLWQLFLSVYMMNKRSSFDLCHSLNFHCDWAPTFLWMLGKPLVWGPINHNDPLPDYIIQGMSKSDRLNEKVKNIFKLFFWNFDPFLQICKCKSNKILIGHQGVMDALKLSPNKCVLFNQIAASPKTSSRLKFSGEISSPVLNVLFVGRGLPIKNYLSILDAYKISDSANSDLIKLSFVGVGKKGREELESRIKLLKLKAEITIIEWAPFDTMSLHYQDSDVLCFPSFEGAGMVIAEALSHGLPVITIDRNGAAHELNSNNSIIIDSSNEDSLVSGIASALDELVAMKSNFTLDKEIFNDYFSKKFSWEAKSSKISKIYESIFN